MSVRIEALTRPVPQMGTSVSCVYNDAYYMYIIYIYQQWNDAVSLWSEWMICEVCFLYHVWKL